MNQRKKTLKKDHNKAERLMKGSASPLKQSNLPSASSPKQPAESSNALKSLLGVGPESITTEAKFAASPAVSQPQPNHQPPINGNNLLQQLFASSSNQQSPQQQQPQAQYSPQQQYMQHPQQYGHQQAQQHPHQQNDILQQLQQATMMQQHQQSRPEQQQQQQQQNGNAHRASFVEELLKNNKGTATDMNSISPAPTTSDNLRRNSLLSVLQGRPKEQTPPAQPTNNLLDAFMKQQTDYYSYAE